MKITGGDLSIDEINAYREHVKANNPGYELTGIHLDGEYVDLEFEPIPFERIRRITGYLVGTTARWNKAKQAELKDRVTHGGDEPSR
jgi:hypothetical protein